MQNLKSANANLLERLIERLTNDVPELRFIGQDIGQLEHYEIRPPVTFPCLLIDLEGVNFTDTGNHNSQLAEGVVSFRLGLIKYTDINNITPAQYRVSAYSYYELEDKLSSVLHGWAPLGFNRLLRRSWSTERREDDLRVRASRFEISYTDTVEYTKHIVPRPNTIIGK
jgi:hypothetical protein